MTLRLTASEEALGTYIPQGEVARALARFGLPGGRRHENWRWSDLRAALDSDVAMLTNTAEAVTPLSAQTRQEITLESAIVLCLLDGRLKLPFEAPQGVFYKDYRRLNVTKPVSNTATLIPAIAQQMAPFINKLRITEKINTPIIIMHQASGQKPLASHLEIEISAGACATFIEVIEPQGATFANRFAKITLGQGAQVTRIIIQSKNTDSTIIHHTDVIAEKNSYFYQTALGFGAKLARIETQFTHKGEGVTASLNGAYLITDNLHLDMTSHVNHGVPGCVTRQLVKGVLSGTARGVFQGKFLVARNAQQSDAQMGHHALMLSPDAEVRAKPELEIYADDVTCAHGNTTGALDENALFYLCQRGLSVSAARALLVNAFLGEVLETVKKEDIRQLLLGLVAKAMETAV